MSITRAIDIADRVQAAEKRNAAALGHDALETFLLSVEAWGQTFDIATTPDRPAVLTRFRPMRTK